MVTARRYKPTPTPGKYAQVVHVENVADGQMELAFDLAARQPRRPD